MENTLDQLYCQKMKSRFEIHLRKFRFNKTNVWKILENDECNNPDLKYYYLSQHCLCLKMIWFGLHC